MLVAFILFAGIATAATRKVYFSAGGGPSRQYRPATLEVSGDGTWTVHVMHWSVWNGTKAIGVGVAWYYCHLTTADGCVGGKVIKHRARVTLTKPARRCAAWFFTRAAMVYLRTNRPPATPSIAQFGGPAGIADVSPGIC
jgi:hypothetical protein